MARGREKWGNVRLGAMETLGFQTIGRKAAAPPMFLNKAQATQPL